MPNFTKTIEIYKKGQSNCGWGTDYYFVNHPFDGEYLVLRDISSGQNSSFFIARADDSGRIFAINGDLHSTSEAAIRGLTKYADPTVPLPDFYGCCAFCGQQSGICPIYLKGALGHVYVCDSCFHNRTRECSGCRKHFIYDQMLTHNERQWFCRTCFENCNVKCGFCGQFGLKENIQETKDHEPICNHCSTSEHAYFRNHSWRPKNFRVVSQPSEEYNDKSFFMGFELEVEAPRGALGSRMPRANLPQVAQEITSDLFYVKHDGSIGYGFEVVSRPFSWDWYKSNPEMISNVLTTLRKKGFRSFDTNTCGMHVHMTKAAFTNLQLYRYMRLFYSYPKFVQWFSRRSEETLLRWANPTSEGAAPPRRPAPLSLRFGSIPESAPLTNRISSRALYKEWHHKYEAVNLAPANTVEVRIFKGTLGISSVFRNIEFCRAVYMFAKSPISNRDINPTNFVQFVAQEHKEYPNLWHQINHSGKRHLSEIDFEKIKKPKMKSKKIVTV